MSDIVELEEPIGAGHELRAEIRRVSNRARARRLTISRFMVALCVLALAIAAVPLVMLMYELIKLGAPVIDKTFFTTVPATPTLVARTPPGASPTPSSAVWPSISMRRFWRFPSAFWSGSTWPKRSRRWRHRCGWYPDNGGRSSILMASSHFHSSCTT